MVKMTRDFAKSWASALFCFSDTNWAQFNAIHCNSLFILDIRPRLQIPLIARKRPKQRPAISWGRRLMDELLSSERINASIMAAQDLSLTPLASSLLRRRMFVQIPALPLGTAHSMFYDNLFSHTILIITLYNTHNNHVFHLLVNTILSFIPFKSVSIQMICISFQTFYFHFVLFEYVYSNMLDSQFICGKATNRVIWGIILSS